MVKKLDVRCEASGHKWEPVRWTLNYRRCWRCERIEVCINDRWQLPTSTKKKRSSSPYMAEAIPMMWTTLIGVSYPDLQIKSYTPLFSSRSAVPMAATQVSMARRARIGQLLEAAARREYPDLRVYLPGERTYGITSGLASWQLVCEHASQEVIDGALSQLVSYQELPVVVESERIGREALVELAQSREWQVFVFKMRLQSGYESDLIVGGVEEDWKRFAFRGYYDQVLEACRRLQEEKAEMQFGDNGWALKVDQIDPDDLSMAISYYEWLVFFAVPQTDTERDAIQLEIRRMDEQAKLLGLRFHLGNQEALLDQIEEEEAVQ